MNCIRCEDRPISQRWKFAVWCDACINRFLKKHQGWQQHKYLQPQHVR